MEETMKREQAEALATLMRANSALERIFNVQDEEREETVQERADRTNPYIRRKEKTNE